MFAAGGLLAGLYARDVLRWVWATPLLASPVGMTLTLAALVYGAGRVLFARGARAGFMRLAVLGLAFLFGAWV